MAALDSGSHSGVLHFKKPWNIFPATFYENENIPQMFLIWCKWVISYLGIFMSTLSAWLLDSFLFTADEVVWNPCKLYFCMVVCCCLSWSWPCWSFTCDHQVSPQSSKQRCTVGSSRCVIQEIQNYGLIWPGSWLEWTKIMPQNQWLVPIYTKKKWRRT